MSLGWLWVRARGFSCVNNAAQANKRSVAHVGSEGCKASTICSGPKMIYTNLSCYRSGTPLASVFTNDFWGLPLSDPESHKSYRPLTVLSFRLDHTLHGLWSPGFHAVNVAAHSLVCLLFLRVCRGFGAGLGPSLAAGLMFVAHPIHTEAVRERERESPSTSYFIFLQLGVYNCISHSH